MFFERLNANALGEFHLAYERIAEHAKRDSAAQERLVIQFAALACMDFKISEEEATFVRWFMDAFDFRPSEFEGLIMKGSHLAIALNHFGGAFVEARTGQPYSIE